MNCKVASKRADATFMLTVWVITLFGFILRYYGLATQPPTGDDPLVAVSAINYMERGHIGPTMWNHPHLRDIFVYAGLKVFGGENLVLRAASLALGTFAIPLLASVAVRMLKCREAALLAAFFFAIDPVHIDYSRQSIQEVYMPFFILAGVCYALGYLDSRKPFMLIISGLSFGLGMASKWYVLFPLMISNIYLGYKIFRDSQSEFQMKLQEIFFLFTACCVIPFTVYLLTFIPWFERGYGISDWFILHKSMLAETKAHGGYSPYTLKLDIKASLWFLKPVSYVDVAAGDGKVLALFAITNPLVWLLTIPAIMNAGYRGFKEKKEGLIFLCCLFLITYLPFLMTRRPIWVHSAFSILPFAFMASAYMLRCFLEKAWAKYFYYSYLALVCVVFIPLYLLAIGKGEEITALQPVVEWARINYER